MAMIDIWALLGFDTYQKWLKKHACPAAGNFAARQSAFPLLAEYDGRIGVYEGRGHGGF
jgi:hypothetical protein